MAETRERSLFLPIAIALVLAIIGVLWFGNRKPQPEQQPSAPAPAVTAPAPTPDTPPEKPSEPAPPAPAKDDDIPV